jgi:hypothetical protein
MQMARKNLVRFELNFHISKLDLRFQINSNGFSRDKSFGHKSQVKIGKVSSLFFSVKSSWKTH